MSLWEMSKEEGTLVGYVPNAGFSSQLAELGDPIAVRRLFKQWRANPVDMQLAKPLEATAARSEQAIPDFVVWSWLTMFSKRSASMAIDMGCIASEFWPCRFQSNPTEEFFFHLPEKTFDIVNVEKSAFRHMLPVDPPIPVFFEHLVTKPLSDYLPPCFRAQLPGREQIFRELFVREDFKLAWEGRGFSGATFRCLAK